MPGKSVFMVKAIAEKARADFSDSSRKIFDYSLFRKILKKKNKKIAICLLGPGTIS